MVWTSLVAPIALCWLILAVLVVEVVVLHLLGDPFLWPNCIVVLAATLCRL